MVIKPYFKLTSNGEDITEHIRSNLISLMLSDHDGDNSDELSFEVSGIFVRPILGDLLSLELGTEANNRNYGAFRVHSTNIDYGAKKTSVSATAVDFVGNIKQKQDKLWESISLSNIAASIAQKHGMQCIYKGADISISSCLQINRSDLDFLHMLSKDYGLVFSIKDNTIVLLPKGADYEFSCNVALSDCLGLSIKRSGRAKYGSVVLQWPDSDTGTYLRATAGAGEPVYQMRNKFPKSLAEGNMLVTAKLEELSRQSMSGNLSLIGDRLILAGGKIILTGAGNDDGDYHVESVSHSMNTSGYVMSVNFTEVKK